MQIQIKKKIQIQKTKKNHKSKILQAEQFPDHYCLKVVGSAGKWLLVVKLSLVVGWKHFFFVNECRLQVGR